MKKKDLLVLLLSFIVCTGTANAQSGYIITGRSLERLFNNLAFSEDNTEKKILNDSIVDLIQQYINTDSVFYHRFNNLRFLGQITSPDSLVKIITWNVAYSGGIQYYYCYLLSRPAEKDKVNKFKLSAMSGTSQIRKDTTYSLNDWYGALYYDIKPVTLENEKVYILLGIDFKDFFLTRKVIEILKFDDGEKIVFGKPVFISADKKYYREVFEYSSTASMTLRFDEGGEIVFDHLSPFSPEYKDNFQYYGPDFSYDSYALENGRLILKQDVDIRNKE
jgi:hypothetical protein